MELAIHSSKNITRNDLGSDYDTSTVNITEHLYNATSHKRIHLWTKDKYNVWVHSVDGSPVPMEVAMDSCSLWSNGEKSLWLEENTFLDVSPLRPSSDGSNCTSNNSSSSDNGSGSGSGSGDGSDSGSGNDTCSQQNGSSGGDVCDSYVDSCQDQKLILTNTGSTTLHIPKGLAPTTIETLSGGLY